MISVAAFQQVFQRLPHHSGHWAPSPRGHHLSSLRPLYSFHVEKISMKFSLPRGLDKMIRKQARAATTCPSWPSGPTPVPRTWPEQGPFLSPLMDTYWLTWVAWLSRPVLSMCPQVESFTNTLSRQQGLDAIISVLSEATGLDWQEGVRGGHSTSGGRLNGALLDLLQDFQLPLD